MVPSFLAAMKNGCQLRDEPGNIKKQRPPSSGRFAIMFVKAVGAVLGC
jgi:hypothetical protein